MTTAVLEGKTAYDVDDVEYADVQREWAGRFLRELRTDWINA